MELKKDTSSPQKNEESREQTENKIADIEANIPIITLHANDLNTTTKRQKFLEWLKIHTTVPTVCYLQEIHFKPNARCKLKTKECKEAFHAKRIEEREWIYKYQISKYYY